MNFLHESNDLDHDKCLKTHNPVFASVLLKNFFKDLDL